MDNNTLPEDQYCSVMKKIRDKLCKEDNNRKVINGFFHGGIELLEKIEEKGEFITPEQPVESVKNMTKLVFTNGQCHWDSCQFYLENKNRAKYDLMTGYAFSPPSWVRHTWLVDKKDGKIKRRRRHPRCKN